MKKITLSIYCIIFFFNGTFAQKKKDLYFFSGYSYGYQSDNSDNKKLFWRLRRAFSLGGGLRWYSKKSKLFYDAGFGVAGAQESYFASKLAFINADDIRTILPSFLGYGQIQFLTMYPVNLRKSNRLDSRIILGGGFQLSFDLSNTTSESIEYNGSEILSTSFAIDSENLGFGNVYKEKAPIPVIIGYVALQLTPSIFKKKYLDVELFIRPSLYAGNKISYDMKTPLEQISGTGNYKLSAFGVKLIGRLHTNQWFKN